MDIKDTINDAKQASKFLQDISGWRWSKSIEIDINELKE